MMNDNETVEVERVNVRTMVALPASVSIGLLLARVPLGGYFILAGAGKIFKQGVGDFVSQNHLAAEKFLSPSMAKFYLTSLPFVELVVGVLLVLGLLTRLAGGLATLLLASFMVGVTGLWTPTGGLFHPNLVFAGLAALLLLAGGGGFSADTALWRKRGVAVTAAGPGITDSTVTTRTER